MLRSVELTVVFWKCLLRWGLVTRDLILPAYSPFLRIKTKVSALGEFKKLGKGGAEMNF